MRMRSRRWSMPPESEAVPSPALGVASVLTGALSRYRVGAGNDRASPGETDCDDAHAGEHRGVTPQRTAQAAQRPRGDPQAHVSAQRRRQRAGGREERDGAARGAGRERRGYKDATAPFAGDRERERAPRENARAPQEADMERGRDIQ